MSFFSILKGAAATDWQGYTQHSFVARLAAGTLEKKLFQHYLRQDYLFLIEFARAYALLAYKADSLTGMRYALSGLNAILEQELSLHLKYCREWGLSEADVLATPPSVELIAYTRFVLDTGQRGDALDLLTALSPCIIGYAEIGAALNADPATVKIGNPYYSWIEMYSGAEYQNVAASAMVELDRQAGARLTPIRQTQLEGIFRTATRLEEQFWPV